MVDENIRLTDLVDSNKFYESRVNELEAKLTVTSQFITEAQFVKEEIDRIQSDYIQPAKFGVISGGIITRQYSFDKFVGYAYQTLKRGYDQTVLSVIQIAEREYDSIYYDQPANNAKMKADGVIENSVLQLLKAGVGYLLYEKFLRDKLTQLNGDDKPKELTIDQIDEFSDIKNIPLPDNPEPMRQISEASFKECLAELFGDQLSKDWGGETCDYFTAHAHLNGNQVSCAFLLKGKADFSPMKLTHLGKNRDQINRLSKVAADIIILQHSHDITPEVRETLNAFALLQCKKWFCFIDGRDSLRILHAYNLFEMAVNKSNTL